MISDLCAVGMKFMFWRLVFNGRFVILNLSERKLEKFIFTLNYHIWLSLRRIRKTHVPKFTVLKYKFNLYIR